MRKIEVMSRRSLLIGAGIGVAVAALPTGADASTLTNFAPNGSDRMGHDAFDNLLQRFVKRDAQRYNRVDYKAFRDQGLGRLKAYLAELEKVDPAKLSRNEAHAFWINLYNAKTIEVVLDHYPVRSIRDIKLGGGGLFKAGPWSRKILTVAGTEISLDDIEHRIVRPLFSDPLSHYGLNCASYSCPNLASRAYTGSNIGELLNQGASEYVNHPRGVRVEGGRITSSKIYSWYADDFGGIGKLKNHWKAYAASQLAAAIDAASIGDYEYDWALNDV